MSTTMTTQNSTTKPAPPSSTFPEYLSPSCQQIAAQDFSIPTQAHVRIRTNLCTPDILPTISQHVCHGVALTPSGLYADMAVTVASYIWRRNRGNDPGAVLPGIKVCDLEVTKTYIIDVPPSNAAGQWLEMEAATEVSEYSTNDILNATVRCTFRSIQPNGTRIHDLAACKVEFEFDPFWLITWSKHTAEIRSQISALHNLAQTDTSSSGNVLHLQRPEAYALFRTFVDYGPKYQNMSSVVVDTRTLAATSTLQFQPDPAQDHTPPFYLDGTCHVSGFVVNAIADTAKSAYISHGITSMRISPMFRPEKAAADGEVIENYVCMQPKVGDATVMEGDVWLLQGGEVVGVWEGVRFKRIPKKLLDVFLPKPKVGKKT